MPSIFVRVAAAAMLAVAVVSCSDSSPTAVSEPGSTSELLGLLERPRTVEVLQRDVALPAPLTVSKSIGVFGGTLAIPEAGLSVYVPAGALLRSTTITITAPAGRAVAYEFSPHGTRFLVPLLVTQQLAGTAHQGTPTSSLFAAYFQDLSQVDLATLLAPVTEILNVSLIGGNAVRFPVGHFSGYLIATGYSGGGSDFAY